MLEATYMATHSSFFTMVNLAEQFGNLKNALGSILGIFALIKFVKKIFYKITGRVYNYGINASEFTKFEKSKEIRRKLKKKSIRPETKNFIKAIGAFLGGCCRIPIFIIQGNQTH